jgi:cytochrome c
MRTLVIAVTMLAASAGTSLAQDAAAGEQVFKRLCSPCHDIGADAKVKLGPPLNGVEGRKSGTYEGFNYSPANKNSGITWDHDAFVKYIRAPMQEMPGTRMAFAVRGRFGQGRSTPPPASGPCSAGTLGCLLFSPKSDTNAFRRPHGVERRTRLRVASACALYDP